MPINMKWNISYFSVLAREVRIPKEAISTLPSEAAISTAFIGIYKEKVHSLLSFDIVELDDGVSNE